MINIFLGWLLGITSAAVVTIFMLWFMALEADKKSDPPTKEEWKVM